MATSSDGGQPRSPAASAQCQNIQQYSEYDVFVQTYNKEKVYAVPDIRKPKVDFYTKELPPQPAAIHEEDTGQQGLRSQETQGGTRQGRGGQSPHVATKSKKKGRQEDQDMPYALDEVKRSNPNRVREQEADDSEVDVIMQIKKALEDVIEPDDPPVIILHSQFLTSKIDSGPSAGEFKIDKNKGEMDILIFHPTLGIHIVEVKSTNKIDFNVQQDPPVDFFSPFDKATTQLIRSQTSIQEEMGDLLENEAVVLTIALPKLGPEASKVIREEAEKRKRKKDTSDAKDGTSSTASKKEILGDHPEILLLSGLTDEVAKEWVQRLKQRRAEGGHAFKGSTADERSSNHREACIRRLSVAGLSPGQAVKDSAALHRCFLLTEEQMRVRDSQAQLLHVWGPPGSGKTFLLSERGRRWVREGRRVALAVGDGFFTPLLHQLTRSVCGDKTDVARVSTHRDWRDLLKYLDTASAADPVFVILDESLGVDYSRLLPHVSAGRVGGVWSAGTRDLGDEYKAAWHTEGGTTVQLQLCLRCPPSVMALANTVRRDAPPLQSPPVPVTRELGVGVEVISHADHGQSQSYEECPSCREGVTNFFSSLGLPEDGKSSLSLSDCVVITTGVYSVTDKERVARWLGGLGLRAVAEDIPSYTPVLLPGQTPQSRDQTQQEAVRSRVVTGTDVEGRPVIHVVDSLDFLGLERAVVVVWHQDREDEDSQGQRDRDGRMRQHRLDWFRAVTRCQGRLLLVAATPSPVLSLLPASSPAMRPSTPPERETLYLPCQASPGLPQTADDVISHTQPQRGQAILSSSWPSSEVEATEKHHSAGTDPTQSATSD